MPFAGHLDERSLEHRVRTLERLLGTNSRSGMRRVDTRATSVSLTNFRDLEARVERLEARLSALEVASSDHESRIATLEGS